MRIAPLVFSSLFVLSACGKNESQRPTSSLPLPKFLDRDVLEFKAASSSFGISASRYDLNLKASTLKKYVFSSGKGYEEEKSVTLSSEVKSSISQKLSGLKTTTYPSCSDCAQNRATVWVEITEADPDVFFFSYEGDCACDSDGENIPTLPYASLKSVYDQILSLL